VARLSSQLWCIKVKMIEIRISCQVKPDVGSPWRRKKKVTEDLSLINKLEISLSTVQD